MYRTELFIMCLVIFLFTILYMFIFSLTMIYLRWRVKPTEISIPPLPQSVDEPNEPQRPQCRNDSLNKMHKYGDEQLQPWNTMCENKDTVIRESYYKKFQPVKIYEQLISSPMPNDASYETNAGFVQ